MNGEDAAQTDKIESMSRGNHTLELTQLLNELDATGFYRLVDPGKTAQIKEISLAKGIIFHRDTGRLFGTSGENLYYGGVKNLLGALSTPLRKVGINLALKLEYKTVTARNPFTGEAIKMVRPKGDAKDIPLAKAGPKAIAVAQNYDEDEEYSITLNQTQWTIWDKGEHDNPWKYAADNVLKMLNALLQDAGSDERFYWFLDDDCEFLALLKEPQYSLIEQSGLLPEWMVLSSEAVLGQC